MLRLRERHRHGDDRRDDPASGIETMSFTPWLSRHPFDAFVVALAAVQQLEVWVTQVPGSRLAVMLATLLWTLPLLLRHRLPFAAPAFAFAVQIATSFLDPQAFGSESTGLIALLATFWVVGAHNQRSQAIAGTAIGFASLAVIAQRDVRVDTVDAIFTMVMGAAVALLAQALQRRAARAAALEQRTGGLEHEREERARAAVVTERARIGRELHDVVAHSLGVMTTQAREARLLVDQDPRRAREPILALEEAGRQALAELRRLLGILHQEPSDATLAPQPGIGDLDALVRRADTAGLPVVLTVEGRPEPLPPGIDLAAYRIVQEALTHALEHADPASARVTVRYGRDALDLEITDEGREIRAGDDETDALVGMRERVALYGGELETGASGGDHAVRVRLPLETSAR
jgi:signal transduction histidine kinase